MSFDQANKACDNDQNILSDNKITCLKSTLKTKNIPTPKLIITDHKKKKDKEGDFPSRLIIPVNKFMSAFPRLGYLGIRRIFDTNQVKYETNIISQASNLKEELENL